MYRQESTSEEKIVRKKLSEQVVERLHEMIRTRELKPGDAMPSERVLMERFGVGRPAVREALQSLHNSGVITISHGERSRVNEITASTILHQTDDLARLVLDSVPATLDHLKQARQMFEVGMVRRAAEVATPEDIATLRVLIEKQRSEIDDPRAFIGTDMEFHRKLATMSENPIVTAVSDTMLGWLFEHHISLLHRSGAEEITLAEHAKIVDLIEAHDVEGAVDEMRRHLERSRKSFEIS